jgi:hypothetical protein
LIRQLLDHPQALWAVAALLYALDVLRLLEPTMFLVEERGTRPLMPLLARAPFELGGRQLYWRGMLTPFWGSFAARLQVNAGERSGPETAQAIDQVLTAVSPVRTLATAQFFLLFVAAPVITSRLGLATAGLVVIPAAYAAAIGTIVVLWRRRRAIDISRRQALTLSVEWLLCVPYTANAVKRIVAARLDAQCDMPSIAARADAQTLMVFSETLAFRNAQALEEGLDEVAESPAEIRKARRKR